jgi:hypothetical protein
MMISKIELKCFQINLMLDLFMCVRLELLELILNSYLLGIKKKGSNFQSHVFGKFFCCLHFNLNFQFIFFPFLSQQELTS